MKENYEIQKIDKNRLKDIENKINNKTKPTGSLGILEETAIRIALIQNSLTPVLNRPVIIIFAGDHGIAHERVSQYPQEVTYQMVYNFLQGGAAINIIAEQNEIELVVVDAGVNHEFPYSPALVNKKVAKGTKNFLYEKAMSREELKSAFDGGEEVVISIYNKGTNIIGFGEMGIGNTSVSSILLSKLCGIPIEDCVGAGTGLNYEGIHKKISILKSAMAKHPVISADPFLLLETFGGFEIAMMCGAMLKAAQLKMVLMIDGFIASVALLVASKINPLILEYCIYGHCSEEKGHKFLLNYLNASPLLYLNMRLGEGSGIAVAYPIIQSSVNIFNKMASFESAGVSTELQ